MSNESMNNLIRNKAAGNRIPLASEVAAAEEAREAEAAATPGEGSSDGGGGVANRQPIDPNTTEPEGMNEWIRRASGR